MPVRTDTSPAALRTAIRDDLVLSATRRRTIAGERVHRTPELTAYRLHEWRADPDTTSVQARREE